HGNARNLCDALGERYAPAAGACYTPREHDLGGGRQKRGVEPQVADRIERRAGLDGEHREIDLTNLVGARATTAPLRRDFPRPPRIARPDDDVITRLREPRRERTAELACAAENSDPHTGTESAASATRRREAASVISVPVTTGWTSSPETSSSSSTTSASIRPG